MQNTYGLFPIIMSNDPCKNKFNHASAKSVPTFGRACVLYGELRVKWTCVIFADFGHGDFLSQNELPKIFFLPQFAHQECQNVQLNLCAEFCACKKYSMRLSDGRFCPRIGALMIHLPVIKVCSMDSSAQITLIHRLLQNFTVYCLSNWTLKICCFL